MEMVKLSFDKDLRDAATNVSHLKLAKAHCLAQADEVVDDTIERCRCRARCSGMFTLLQCPTKHIYPCTYLYYSAQADEIANARDVHKDEVSGRLSI